MQRMRTWGDWGGGGFDIGGPLRVGLSRCEALLGVLLGLLFTGALFVAIALAQMLGQVDRPQHSLHETVIAFNPPEVEKIEEEEEPPPEREEELAPELEHEPATQITLDQLDLALNPSTGGKIAADFRLPSAARMTVGELDTEDFVDFSELDQIPRPIGVYGFRFPHRLLRREAHGTVVLLLRLDERGEVLDVRLDSSDLPDFDDFVLGEVAKWRFTPPTRKGHPVKARARLPIPIHVKEAV